MLYTINLTVEQELDEKGFEVRGKGTFLGVLGNTKIHEGPFEFFHHFSKDTDGSWHYLELKRDGVPVFVDKGPYDDTRIALLGASYQAKVHFILRMYGECRDQGGACTMQVDDSALLPEFKGFLWEICRGPLHS